MFSRKKDKDAKDTKKKGESTSDEVAVSDTHNRRNGSHPFDQGHFGVLPHCCGQR
jgi:hypothetical protein